MKCVLFYHAFSSCWNNGNAHFLRGVTRALHGLGHEVVMYEPADGWSRLNAISDGGEQILGEVGPLFPGIDVRQYHAPLDLDQALDGADLVLVHEWNPRELVERIGRARANGGSFLLFFHDTHHRAVTARHEFEQLDLDGYDGVLAFGEVLRQIYLSLGWASRAFTWHEAADTALYYPMTREPADCDLLWIGNWGDDERSAELDCFVVSPVRELGIKARMYGVRYPVETVDAINAAGIEYGGWLPAHRAPQAFARSRATVHVPRGPYAQALPGIPTIRMFEAMACGVPIISAPWSDCEKLFPSGTYLHVRDGDEMKRALRSLLSDADLARAVRNEAMSVVTQHHTCRHRAIELLAIANSLRTAAKPAAASQPIAEVRP
jgi:spore maturation protein CgeB